MNGRGQAPNNHRAAGTADPRAFVGPPQKYDLVAAMQFNLLTFLGLREQHTLLDIGCGSLRAGKLFIPYLQEGGYYGIEPEQWLVAQGIEQELGEDILRVKKPVFSYTSDFDCGVFEREFDYILAQSIFSHATQQQVRTCVSEAGRVMKPSSLFLATFIVGDRDYSGDEWVYPSCVTYTARFMEAVAESCGLACRLIGWPHPNRQQWMALGSPQRLEAVADIGDITNLFRLQSELDACQNRLTKIESHPVVRVGLAVRKLSRRIRGHARPRS